MGPPTGWRPASIPQTRLFYVNTQTAASLWYLVLNDDHKPDGHQGGTLSDFWSSSQLKALDYETGKTVWQRDLGKGHSFTGVLTTAGHCSSPGIPRVICLPSIPRMGIRSGMCTPAVP